MKKKRIVYIIFIIFILSSKQVFAYVTPEQVETVGKETATGNFLIWFLCAIGFLKVSQKIDSFMQMIGINVGKTGGSMLGDAAVVLKTLALSGKNGLSGSNKSYLNNNKSSYSDSFLQGGLAGAVSRQISRGAIENITGRSNTIGSNIARSFYNSSVNNNGAFSNSIIGNIAKGDATQIGFIKGEDAVKAFNSYMGLNKENGSASVKENFGEANIGTNAANTKSDLENNSLNRISSEYFKNASENNDNMADTFAAQSVIDEYRQNMGLDIPTKTEFDSSIENNNLGNDSFTGISDKIDDIINDVPYQNTASDIPDINSDGFSTGMQQISEGGNGTRISDFSKSDFSNIEIGGGRIIGYENSKEQGGKIQFAMYSADKYMQPTKGEFKTVVSVDGSKWYHQYAQNTVTKEPFMKSDGKIMYNEKIEKKLPEAPKRKDRI